MNRTLCLLLALLCLAGAASAYQIYFDIPEEIVAGEDLVIEGTSTLPAGLSVEITLFRTKPNSQEIVRDQITIQGDGTWTITFETSGLQEGTYKVEIEEKTGWEDHEYIDYEYGSGSDTLKTFMIIDRSDELSVTAPLVQTFDGTLEISGSVQELGEKGVEITVVRQADSETVFGPRYIKTDEEGAFSTEIPITESGAYDVIFRDTTGYLGKAGISVTQPAATATETETPEPEEISASASASRDSPAYFAITGGTGEIEISTSTGVDWVMEYVDGAGSAGTVNNQGTLEPESAVIVAGGGTVYLKVYPVRYTVQETVTINVMNAESIKADASAATAFGDTPQETPTQESPLPLVIPAIALLFAVLSVKRQ
jgi:5-hydroxyisourate hydrolase-like protein (transthyretin family)